jgi:hypothetical protein
MLCRAVPWLPIQLAPEDCDLEVGELDKTGIAPLRFPCRRKLGVWYNAWADEPILICPTHWRVWRAPHVGSLPQSAFSEERLGFRSTAKGDRRARDLIHVGRALRAGVADLSVSRLSQEAGFAETRKRSERIVWLPRARRSRSFPARSFGKARRLRSATRPSARNTGQMSSGPFRQPRRRSSQRPHRSCTACRCRHRRLRNNPFPRSAPVELATTMTAGAAGSDLPVYSRRRV